MSSFSVVRAANGQIVMSLNNVKDYEVKEMGVITGNTAFSLGQTEKGSDETVLMLNGSSLDFKAEATFNSFDFKGKNVNADFNEKNHTPYNVSWGVQNGTFDSSKSKSSVIFESTAESENTLVKLDASKSRVMAQYDNLVFDGGKNNMFITNADSANRFETLETSNGAVIEAGNGKNDFYIGGSYGVFAGGNGKDNFATSSTARDNIMLGKDGDDTMSDYGKFSLFIGGLGFDTANLSGQDSIANLGFDEAGGVLLAGSNNAAFTGEEQTDSYGNVYNYAQIMKDKGWNLETFLFNSGIKDTPYYTQMKTKLEEIFQ